MSKSTEISQTNVYHTRTKSDSSKFGAFSEFPATFEGGSKTRGARTAVRHAVRIEAKHLLLVSAAKQMFKLVDFCGVIKHELLISKIGVSCFSIMYYGR